MGVETTVKIRCVVRYREERCDDGIRLLEFLRELATNGLLVEPIQAKRDKRLGQLVCSADSFLRNKSGFDRFFDKRKFPATHLPTLCEKYEIEVEVWASCGEVGYDEHFVVDYSGKIVTQEDMKTVSWDEFHDKKPTSAQKVWNRRWGKWTIPSRSEYAAECARRKQFLIEERERQKKWKETVKKCNPGGEISTADFFSDF